MSRNSEESRFPRPVERLPDFAHAKSRKTLADKLVGLGLSAEAASTIGNTVVDPGSVRKKIGEVSNPQLEAIRVQGGTLYGLRAEVWSRLVMPDPRNPRIGPSRRHPFAVEPGTGDEQSRFRPVPEPRSPDGSLPTAPELVVDVESRDHLTWANAQAAQFVLAKNDWRNSIASQGVMESVWLTATTYMHSDGTANATVLTTVEGSSRITSVHDLLDEVRSADIPYNDEPQKLKRRFRKLNEALDRGVEPEEAVQLRCERVPALIIVGFQPHEGTATTFPTAIKSLVAFRHVDPPTVWGPGPENEALADEVLDELYRQDLISSTERDYFAGNCTKAEARAAHLSDDPATRAARIMSLFKKSDPRVDKAIRHAVTSQSTRKAITALLRNQLATALILRSVSSTAIPADKIRPYMHRGFSSPVHSLDWDATERQNDVLKSAAMDEVKAAIADESILDPGPATLELAVRAAYPLLVTGKLSRGTDNVDRRTPGEVLDAMRRTIQGVEQLFRALEDHKNNARIRVVDEKGAVRKITDGSSDQIVSEKFLREQFPAPGKVRSRPSGKTLMEVFQNRLADFSEAMEALESAFECVGEVTGEDGLSIAEAVGANPESCKAWREMLSNIDDELNVWARTFRRVYGVKPEPALADAEDFENDDEYSYADEFGSKGDDWESSEPSEESVSRNS